MIVKNLMEQEFDKFRDDLTILLRESYLVNFPTKNFNEGYFLNKICTMYKYIKDNRAVVYIAVDEKVRGLIWLLEREYVCENRLHINEIAVKQEYRGKGVGKKLIEKAFVYARDKGISVIDLNVMSSNNVALNFYTNLGFNIESYLMSLKL